MRPYGIAMERWSLAVQICRPKAPWVVSGSLPGPPGGQGVQDHGGHDAQGSGDQAWGHGLPQQEHPQDHGGQGLEGIKGGAVGGGQLLEQFIPQEMGQGGAHQAGIQQGHPDRPRKGHGGAGCPDKDPGAGQGKQGGNGHAVAGDQQGIIPGGEFLQMDGGIGPGKQGEYADHHAGGGHSLGGPADDDPGPCHRNQQGQPLEFRHLFSQKDNGQTGDHHRGQGIDQGSKRGAGILDAQEQGGIGKEIPHHPHKEQFSPVFPGYGYTSLESMVPCGQQDHRRKGVPDEQHPQGRDLLQSQAPGDVQAAPDNYDQCAKQGALPIFTH